MSPITFININPIKTMDCPAKDLYVVSSPSELIDHIEKGLYKEWTELKPFTIGWSLLNGLVQLNKNYKKGLTNEKTFNEMFITFFNTILRVEDDKCEFLGSIDINPQPFDATYQVQLKYTNS